MLAKRLTDLVPYLAGEQPRDQQYIKLNTNENPFPPPAALADFIRNFDYRKLRLYPDPAFWKLRCKMAEVYELNPGQVFICNGSDEGLAFCFYAFFDPAWGNVLFPGFSYSFYPVYCNLYQQAYKRIPLNPDFSIDVELYLQEAESAGLIIPNPNAPTGILLPAERLEYLLKHYAPDRVVIIDEAYIDFGGESVIPLLAKYKNLVIVRTFSKAFSMAGLRLGYIFAAEALIEALFKVKDSFNSYPVNTFTQELACAAFSYLPEFQMQNRIIVEVREDFSRQLSALGWQVLPSAANFVFASKPGWNGSRVYLKLKEKGILVRHFSSSGIENFVRITIGKKEDMQRLLEVMGEF